MKLIVLLSCAGVVALLFLMIEMERRSRNWQVIYPDGSRSRLVNYYRASCIVSLRGGNIIKLKGK